MQAHHDLLHQGHNRVYHELRRAYYWPNMQKTIEIFVTKYTSCQESKMWRQHLKTAFHDRELRDLPLPRQSYGFDFYGVPRCLGALIYPTPGWCAAHVAPLM
jgi:hypothetical protein